MKYWWQHYGKYHPADNTHTYPDPREVIRDFMQQREKTAEDLAGELGIKRRAAYYVLSSDNLIDRYSVRVKTCHFLAIPPSLLGLAEEIIEDLQLGQIIKRYRKEKHWTRQQLADAFDPQITAFYVFEMETKEKGLDSMKRRHALQFILGIVPTTLGLANTPKVVSELAVIEQNTYSLATALPKYANRQAQFFQDYYAPQGQPNIKRMLEEITILNNAIPQAKNAVERSQVIKLETDYHNLVIWTARENLDITRAMLHAKTNISLATYAYQGEKTTANAELLALAYFHRAEAYRESENIFLASQDITKAMSYKNEISSLLRCRILVEYGTIMTLYASQHGENMRTGLSYLDEAEKLLPLVMPLDDPHHSKFNDGFYFLRRVQALPPQSKELDSLIAVASRHINGVPRRTVILNAYQAQHQISQGDTEGAVDSAIYALQNAQALRSKLNKNRINQVYTNLVQIDDPVISHKVARLGLMLQSWQ